MPNCPCVIFNSSLILGLNNPRKKLCPKLEKNVKINPNKITFKLKFLNIKKMTCNVAFIGLGVMGYPMAGYISKAGHNVTVFNRTGSKADKWISEYKGTKADTPAKAAENAEYILTCVGNDNDLREVTFGEKGIFKTIKEGTVYIDNTTASATIAREINDYAKKNKFGFLDAPVSGGQAGAENGALTVMIGGDQKDYDKANHIIDCYSKKNETFR